MKKILLFDFDGTLANSISVVTKSFQNTFLELAVPYPGDCAIRAQIGKHLQDIFLLFLPPETIDIAVKIYRKYYLVRQDREEIHPFPDVPLSIRSLYKKGFRMGIVTTKLRKYTEPLVEKFGLSDCFECIVGAEDVKKCKPHPEPLFLAAEKMGVSPKNTIYIGDSVHDAQAAKAANMQFIGVLTGVATSKELAKYGKVFKNLQSFSC